MIKTMMTWHGEKTSRICRERTGGAGYLWVNQLGDAIMGSHSGITAEGDNKVLMQKVTKDVLTHYRKKQHDNFTYSKVQLKSLKELTHWDFDTMRNLIYLREELEIKNIAKKL